MAMRAHYAAAKEDCNGKAQLFQELPEFKVVAVAVIERDDERFGRQPPHLTLRSSAQIVRQRNDMVAGPERLKMFPSPHSWQGMIHKNGNLPSLDQLTQQERYPGIAKKDEDHIPKKSQHAGVWNCSRTYLRVSHSALQLCRCDQLPADKPAKSPPPFSAGCNVPSPYDR